MFFSPSYVGADNVFVLAQLTKQQRSAIRQENEANARSAFEGTGCVSNALEIESEDDGGSGGEDGISFGSSVDAGKAHTYERYTHTHDIS